jgi:hypothetical protein
LLTEIIAAEASVRIRAITNRHSGTMTASGALTAPKEDPMKISTMTISYTVEENREEHREREAVRSHRGPSGPCGFIAL